jgi:hypothetical protein
VPGGAAAGPPQDAAWAQAPPFGARLRAGLAARVAAALLVAGLVLLNGANASLAHIVGVVSLFGFIVAGLTAILPDALAQAAD